MPVLYNRNFLIDAVHFGLLIFKTGRFRVKGLSLEVTVSLIVFKYSFIIKYNLNMFKYIHSEYCVGAPCSQLRRCRGWHPHNAQIRGCAHVSFFVTVEMMLPTRITS